jgi:hypothetical protein
LNFEGFSRDFEICSRFLGFYGELFEEFLIKGIFDEVYQDFVDMGMALTTDLTNRKGQIAVMATDIVNLAGGSRWEDSSMSRVPKRCGNQFILFISHFGRPKIWHLCVGCPFMSWLKIVK